MTDKRYTITSLMRCGTYRIAQQGRESVQKASAEGGSVLPPWNAEQAIFTSTYGDTIRLIHEEPGTHTLWEMTGFHLHRAVLPFYELLAAERVPPCPVAVSDTRLAFLLPNDTPAAVTERIRRTAMEKLG